MARDFKLTHLRVVGPVEMGAGQVWRPARLTSASSGRGAQAALAGPRGCPVVAAGGGTSGVGAGAATPVSRGSGTSGGWCGVAAKLDAVLVKMDQLLHKYQSLLRST
jgi:murein DD-endopeptidase MepM/ murein hydrolase activator NlpD